MNPKIEQILKLPAYQRALIVFVIMAVVVGACTWLVFMPQYDEIARLKSQGQSLQLKYQQDQRIANNLPKFKAEYQKMKGRLEEALAELPNKQEIPTLLTSIASIAKDSGLEVVRFKPAAEISKGFYAEVPVSLELTGTYHQTAAFSFALSKLPRIVNLTNLKLDKNSSGNKQSGLKIECDAVTFRFVDKPVPDKGKKK